MSKESSELAETIVDDRTTAFEVSVEEEPRVNNAVTIPEGGLQAWLTVGGGWMVVFCTFGAIQSFGVYQDYYTRFSLNKHPPSDVSWIGSVQIFFLFSGGIFSGKLFDDGRFRQLLLTGSSIYLISSFLLSLAQPHHYYQNMLAQGIGMGVGMGMLFLPSVSVTAHYFKRRRGIAMGIIISGSSIGALLYPIIINHLFISIGFGWGVRIVSFLDLALLVTANLVMKTRLPSRKDDPTSKPIDFKGILRDGPFWIALFGISMIFWGLLIPFFYIQLFAAKSGISGQLTTYCISILNAAGFFGRTIPMFLSDLFGQFNVIIPCTVVSGGLAFAFLSATSSTGLVLFAILYGFFSGGFLSTCVATAASFSRDLGEVGTRIGIMTFCASFFLLTGNPISGAVLNPPEYTWLHPILFSGLTVLGGAVLLITSRTLQAARKGSQRL